MNTSIKSGGTYPVRTRPWASESQNGNMGAQHQVQIWQIFLSV